MKIKRIKKITVNAVNPHSTIEGRLQDTILSCTQKCKIPVIAMTSDDGNCEIKIRCDIEQLNKLIESLMEYKALFYIRTIS